MKKPDPHPSRQNPRLKGYDYSQAGAYFVTICAHNREMLFGAISEDEMCRNEFGAIVTECWAAIPQHFPGVELADFVVMPNHVHGILVFHNEDEGRACPALIPSCRVAVRPDSG